MRGGRWSWPWGHGEALRKPYGENLSALVHEPSFAALAGPAVQAKARLIVEHGNRAVHSGRCLVTRLLWLPRKRLRLFALR